MAYRGANAQTGTWWRGGVGIRVRTSELQARQVKIDAEIAASGKPRPLIAKIERELALKTRNNPASPSVAAFSSDPKTPLTVPQPNAPQTIGTNFIGPIGGNSGSDSPYVPPDTQGAVGPTQVIISVNGRIRSYNKTTGVADGAINLDQDTFFAAVQVGGVSDPVIRYDRLTQRWFNTAIDVGGEPNNVLIGVSDGATITSGSVWTLFAFQQNLPTPSGENNCFFDYPTTGIDENGLIIGGNQFCPNNFAGSTVFVVKKSSVLGAGPIEVAAFRGLTNIGAATGITTARGVDSWNTGLGYGYVIGDDYSRYGLLNLYKVTYGVGAPTFSAVIELTVPQTSDPIPADHLGNTGGQLGKVDAIDMRVMPAVIRDGFLWASHTISVNSSGVANGSTLGDRDAGRWYKIGNLGATPTLSLSGTIFDNGATNPFSYLFTDVMVSGQGHVAFGNTRTSAVNYLGAATTGFLAGQTSAPTPVEYRAGVGAYNSFDGTTRQRRWGDYSQVALDPCDDMTMWSFQEFAAVGSTTNTAKWGIAAAQLIAPAPPTLNSATPNSIAQGQFNQNITISATSSNGTGFYDTPNNMSGEPCRRRLVGTISNGVTVNSVTVNSATSVTLNITTFGATTGAATVTLTNPDGQFVSGGLLTITTGTANATPTNTSTSTNTPTRTATATATNTPIASSCVGTHTAGSPKFNRPLPGNPPTSLSSVGTTVPYKTLTFTVSLTGSYTLEMTAANFTPGDADDGFYVLYSPSFNPAAPLTNALQADDDSGVGFQPLITRTLTAGTTYLLVSATYANNVTGTFTDKITGPGAVNGFCNPLVTATATSTSTATATATASPTQTLTATATRTLTATASPTQTLTATATRTFTLTPSKTMTPVPARPDTGGVFKDGTFYLRNSNNSGPADIISGFGGAPSDLPTAGDWDGNGVDTIGVYRGSEGRFYLSDSNTSPIATYAFFLGNPGDVPFAGKWVNTMTHDGAGVYRNSNGILYQKKELTTGPGDYFAIFGNPGDQPVAGDWNGDGLDSIGIYRSSETKWYLTNNSQPSGVTFADFSFVWTIGPNYVIVGDWNADVVSTVGFYTTTGVFVQHSANASAGTDNVYGFGPAGAKPISGKWVAASGPGVINPLVNGTPIWVEGGGNGID